MPATLATRGAPVEPNGDIMRGQGTRRGEDVPRATLNGITLAESDRTEIVEGNLQPLAISS
jgi:hypothetical protein